MEALMDLSLSPAAQWSLVIIAIVNLLLMFGLIAGVIVGIVAFKKLRAQIQPTLDRANGILDETKQLVVKVSPMLESEVKPILHNVQEMTHKAGDIVTDVGHQAHEIAETSQRTVKKTSKRIETTGKLVTEGVTRPVIQFASMTAGIGRALSVMRNHRSKTNEPQQDE
jgi:hypothetical protein